MSHPAGSVRFRPVRAVAGLTCALGVTLASCRADSPTDEGAAGSLAISVQPALVPSAADATARPINRVRASALRATDEALVGVTTVDVNPTDESWTLGLSVDAEGGVSVYVTVHLLNVAADETEEVQFSGRAGPFVITGVPVSPDVPIVRGPLDNLAVTSVSIASAPTALPLGASAPVVASVAAAIGAEPVLFWTSLDPDVLTAGGDTVTASAVGTAELVASAGAYADTVSIEVIDPDSIPPVLLGTEPKADALGAARGRPIVATFDEAIDPASLTDSAFVLRDSLGLPVPASLSVAGAVVSLTPDVPLAAAARYTAALGAGISDLSGNVLGDPISWSFTTGGLALLGASFDPGLGTLVAIAFDEATELLYLHDDFSDSIRVFDQKGAEVGPSIPRPGVSSNDIDFDFTEVTTILGATTLPPNTLLIHNGEQNPGTIFGIDKSDGAVLDSVVVATSGNVVGGAFHPLRETFYAVSWNTNEISEVELATGAILNTFPVAPAGSPAYTMNYGDLEVDPASGNLYLVSSNETRLRVLTPVGAWLEDYDLATIDVIDASGIAWDPVARAAWITSTGGMVFRVDGVDPG